jgi:glutamate racemase
VHRERLLQKGIPKNRIVAVSCHGLAAAIEKDPAGAMVAGLIEQCAAEACRADLSGEPFYVGLCCTHYSYVKEQFRSVLKRQSGKRVQILDPNDRMVRCLAAEKGQETGETGLSSIVVEVISQVELSESQRRAVAKLVAPVSEIAAQALLSYTWRPGLF